MTAQELPLDARQMAALFRALTLSSCQVDNCGDAVWYFDGGLVLRHRGEGFWLSVSPTRGDHPGRHEDTGEVVYDALAEVHRESKAPQ